MIKSILAAIALSTATALPAFADAPKAFSSSLGSGRYDGPPSITSQVVDVPSNVYCRSRARAKYFELGGKDFSVEDSNSQWATFGTSMRALVWCRSTTAVIIVAGSNVTSINELRDEIVKAF